MLCKRCGLEWKPGICPDTCTDHSAPREASRTSKTLWQQAWVAHPDGTSVREVKASVAQYNVTVRELGETKGGRQYTPAYFETYFGATRDEAIDRFVAHHTVQIEVAQAHIEETQQWISNAQKLRGA